MQTSWFLTNDTRAELAAWVQALGSVAAISPQPGSQYIKAKLQLRALYRSSAPIKMAINFSEQVFYTPVKRTSLRSFR